MSETSTEQLLEAARTARGTSYAPYSDFKAGAAAECADGAVITGVIVENVSLGLAMCAERVAMFSAVAQGKQLTRLALVAPSTADRVTWPCGACLQVALELGGADMEIWVGDVDNTTEAHERVRALIPRGPKIKLGG